MMAESVRFYANRLYALSIGDLLKTESDEANADFGPNWIFAIDSKDHRSQVVYQNYRFSTKLARSSVPNLNSIYSSDLN